ncbi:unnamed protein product [Schistocephalus solidus]|uniref:Uncharacterized protein n=1 Tax=Schistocephalus solidus TaxID=70667 RepID=A0A183SF36_SCHSO|nr:unnamed protein product [Schistocephalus solidus]
MGLFGHMHIHDSGIHRNADNTDTQYTPSASAILTAFATPNTTNEIPPASPDFSCPHCTHPRNCKSIARRLVNQYLVHQHTAGITASTALTVLAHSLIA